MCRPYGCYRKKGLAGCIFSVVGREERSGRQAILIVFATSASRARSASKQGWSLLALWACVRFICRNNHAPRNGKCQERFTVTDRCAADVLGREGEAPDEPVRRKNGIKSQFFAGSGSAGASPSRASLSRASLSRIRGFNSAVSSSCLVATLARSVSEASLTLRASVVSLGAKVKRSISRGRLQKLGIQLHIVSDQHAIIDGPVGTRILSGGRQNSSPTRSEI